MNREIKFKKNRIYLGILFFGLMFFISISFLANPKIFIRNVFMKEEHIQILGTIGFVYFPILIFSFLKIIKREYAILITDEFLIDTSKYESIGSIEWKSISNIKRIKKKSIELNINKPVLQKRKMNLLEKFLGFMHNWNYKESIIISSALIDCSIEELFEALSVAWKNNKLN